MVLIKDILDVDLLEKHLNNGYVSERAHPENPDLVILNYTNKTNYDKMWDNVTLQTRGLIYNKATGEILAKAWNKFFNHDQAEGVDYKNFGEVEVTDKLDGSLILGYRDNTGALKLATKGSFNSEMIPVAEDVLSGYHEDFPAGITPLFEVIYPENRIVVDYKGIRDLFLLGGVVLETGEVLSPYDERLSSYNGPRTTVFEATSIDEALRIPPRDNAEGIIVREKSTGNMVKIKQQDYVDLHRVVTGITSLSIWKAVHNGSLESDILDIVPDELYDEVDEVVNKLYSQVDAFKAEMARNHNELCAELGINPDVSVELSREDKKNLALSAFKKYNKQEASDILMFRNSKEDAIFATLWRRIRPVGEEAELIGFGLSNKKGYKKNNNEE